MTLFWLIFISLFLYVATRVYIVVSGKQLVVSRRCDEIHYVKTSDDWTLALHRYKPRDLHWAQPVVLCHGMGANRFNFDIAQDRSLARTLALVGFDVWTVELRGHGLSEKPSWHTPFGWNYNFDDFLLKDIPAALQKVQEVTAQENVFWLGHSMGGMLGLAHAGTNKSHGLAGLVAVGSPVSLRGSGAKTPFRFLSKLVVLGRVVRLAPLARFFAPLSALAPGSLSAIFMFPGSTEQRLIRRIMFNLVESEPTDLIRQFGRWQAQGTFNSEDAQTDYLEALASVDIPLLILAAEKDRLAGPSSVAPAYERANVKDKQFRVFGTDAGDEFDFGHGDILLGRLAPKVVYTEIVDWLESRATPIE